MSAYLARFKTDLAPILVVADGPDEALDALRRAEVATPDALIELPTELVIAAELSADRRGNFILEPLDDLDAWLEEHEEEGDEEDGPADGTPSDEIDDDEPEATP